MIDLPFTQEQLDKTTTPEQRRLLKGIEKAIHEDLMNRTKEVKDSKE